LVNKRKEKREKMILYRPVNQAELDLIIKGKWKKFPPRLEGQPIFYPVLNEAYAVQITKEWNVPSYGIGHVLKFEVEDTFLKKYKIQKVGLDHHVEFWILAEELEEMNKNIIGEIELIKTFK
jgi:hypothetical protein